MKRQLIAAAVAVASLAGVSAQERLQAYIQTDLTSAYLWRGQKVAGTCIQPQAGLRWKGAHLYVWGNTELTPPAGQPDPQEIDIFFDYNITPALMVGLHNVYVSTNGDSFLSYKPYTHAANSLELMAAYDFRYFNFEWNVDIAGADGSNHSGNRSYSSYCVVSAPFTLGAFDLNARVGIVPYYTSRYLEDRASGFHVNMCALRASHTFLIASAPGLALQPYTQLMVNPSARAAYFQVALRLLFAPKS